MWSLRFLVIPLYAIMTSQLFLEIRTLKNNVASPAGLPAPQHRGPQPGQHARACGRLLSRHDCTYVHRQPCSSFGLISYKFPFFGASHGATQCNVTQLPQEDRAGFGSQHISPVSVLPEPVLLSSWCGTLTSLGNQHRVLTRRQTRCTANSLKIHTHFLQWYTA